MGKIQMLSDAVTARIAAGEVVERPASIVKECVENAVDAGATAISIRIEEGGIREIQVTDNGSGIEKEDMPLTIVKHATSKIYTLDDLNAILSMGFRGEALSSIAAVSMLTIRSRTPHSETGTELYVKGGKVEYIREAGLPEGTTVLVENLFYNTPARLKFLKRPGTEAAAITDIVGRLVLAYPQISFRYSSGGKMLIHSPGGGDLLGAILSVHGPQIRPNLIPVDHTWNNIRVTGYIGAPGWSYKTQKAASAFVNHRFIRSAIIQNAVQRSYGERLLRGNYPFYVLHISLDLKDVDVNVHPNKMAVHFSDDSAIDYAVGSAVSDTLLGYRASPQLHVKGTDAPLPARPAADAQDPGCIPQSELKEKIDEVLSMLPQREAQPVRETYISASSELYRKGTMTSASFPTPVVAPEAPKDPQEVSEQQIADLFDAQEKQVFTVDEEAAQQAVLDAQQPSFLAQHIDYTVLGVAFSSYIIVEVGDRLYFIDQHAAHERLLYDKLLALESGRRISQRLLVGYQIHASASEAELIRANQELFAQMGMELTADRDDPFTFEIRSVPQILGDVNPRAAFQDILAELEEGRGEEDVIARRAKIAKGACKRAVKAGQPIPPEDIEHLIRQIQDSGGLLHCPHGRPIAIVMDKIDLEKGFKRRV